MSHLRAYIIIKEDPIKLHASNTLINITDDESHYHRCRMYYCILISILKNALPTHRFTYLFVSSGNVVVVVGDRIGDQKWRSGGCVPVVSELDGCLPVMR